jgi:hypothetical protein
MDSNYLEGGHHMPRTCVFCGRRADSLEHVWPQWISRHLANRGPFKLVDRTRGRTVQFGNVLDVKIRRVCKTCNNGWMSQLETRAKPLLEPMFDGTPVTLHPNDQAVLALWSIKTLMMTDLWHDNPDVFSPNHHWEVYQTRKPPLDVSVLIAALEEAERNAVYSEAAQQGTERHRLMMTFERLVVQVRLLAPSASVQHGWDTRRSAVQLWPIERASVDWPPPEPLNALSVTHFATPGMAFD